jgi:hypothetical protein
MKYSTATFRLLPQLQLQINFAPAKTPQIAQDDSSLTVRPARVRPLVLSTMGVPFEALLPYGIMIGVRWLSL